MAGKTLAWANRMIDGHCGGLLWSKELERRTYPRGKSRLLVSVYVGGVVRVRDCDTGRLIAESKPGKANDLADGFVPEIMDPHGSGEA